MALLCLSGPGRSGTSLVSFLATREDDFVGAPPTLSNADSWAGATSPFSVETALQLMSEV